MTKLAIIFLVRHEKILIWERFHHVRRNFVNRPTIECYNGGTVTQYFNLERSAR